MTDYQRLYALELLADHEPGQPGGAADLIRWAIGEVRRLNPEGTRGSLKTGAAAKSESALIDEAHDAAVEYEASLADFAKYNRHPELWEAHEACEKALIAALENVGATGEHVLIVGDHAYAAGPYGDLERSASGDHHPSNVVSQAFNNGGRD